MLARTVGWALVVCVLGSTSALWAQDDEPELPPVEVPRPEDVEPGDFEPEDPFDLPWSYPDLSQQIFGADNGVFRMEQNVFDVPRHATIIDRQQITETQPFDLGQALENTSGVFVQRTGRAQASPFIRGLTGQQILILVDGIRMTNSIFRPGPNQYFGQFDPYMVERLEVLRGPGSVQWGSDAIGGVINVVTKSPTLTGYDYISGSTNQRGSTADVGYLGRVSVESSYKTSGLYGGVGGGNFNNIDRGGDLGRQPATSFNQFSGDIKFTNELDDYNRMIVSLQHVELNDVFRTDRFERGDERIFDPQQRDLAYIRFEGEICHPLADDYSITGSYQRLKESQIRHNDNMGNFDEESIREFDNHQVGLNLVFHKDLSCEGYGRFAYGIDTYHEDIDSFRKDIDFTVFPPDETILPGPFPDDAYYTRMGAFAEWNVDLTDRMLLTTGLRYSYIKAGATLEVGMISDFISPSYDDWSSSVGMTYELNPCWHLVASFAEGFRAPNIDDLAAVNDDTFAGTQIPDPNLKPERAQSYEIGTKYNGPQFRGEAFVFWTYIKDNILRQPVGDPLDPDFILVRENRDSRLNGVELSGEYLLLDGWSVYGNFTFVEGFDLEEDEPLSRVNPTQATLGFRWRDECSNNWFDTYLWMVARQDKLSARDLADTVRIPPGGTPGYTTLNFRYGRVLDEHQRLIVNLENVTDKAYRVHGSGADAPGINLVVGYELVR